MRAPANKRNDARKDQDHDPMNRIEWPKHIKKEQEHWRSYNYQADDIRHAKSEATSVICLERNSAIRAMLRFSHCGA